ncbi:Helicase domino [Halotydeus destructor]|nr:Helicase domino [Halotydeus destructor]
MYISSHHMEQMPMWAPPTPPQDDTDFYVDHSVGFMYESTAMPESQLPPVYVQKENKRLRVEPSVVAARKQQKMRKEELLVVPKSLFDRPSPVVIKLRKEVKVQKARGNLSGGPDVAQLQKILSVLAPNVQLPTPPTLVAQFQNSKTSHILLAGLQHENTAPWTINEEFSIMQALQLIQELPANLLVLSPGHLPNWDLVSDLVSSMSPNFRAPRVCRHHYETAVIPREEGKVLSTEPPPKKKKQMKNQPPTTAAPPLPPTTPTVPGAPVATPAPKGRPVKTSYLFKQDDHHQFSQLSNTRFETLKSISIKKAPSMKPIFMSGTNKNNPKHIALLHDNGIQYEAPLTPQSIADLRQKRIVSEKAKQNEQANRQKQMQLMQARQQQAQVRGPAPVPQQQLMNALQQQQPQQFAAMQARAMQAMGQQVATSGATLTRGPTPPSAGSSLASSTASQEVAHIAKALSQAAATFTAQAAAGPQSLQANVQVGARVAVSSAGTIVGTTAQLISGGNVVSVSNLPQNQQKLIITSVPAGQAGPKYTPQQLQAYKQRQLLQQQQPKMQQAQILANVGQTIQSQGSQGQGNQVLLSTAGGSIAGRVTVSGAGSGQLVPVSAGTVSVSGAGNVVSMSALPSTQQKLIITALPAGQGGHKLTAQQLQQYTKTLQFQQAKAQQAQLLQSNAQNIQSQVSHANQVQLNPSIVGLSTGRVTVTTTSAGVGQLVSNAGSSQGIVVSAASLQNQAKLITVPAGQVAPKLTQQQLQQILQQPKMQQAQILTTSGAQSIQSQNQITAQMQIQQIAQQLQSSGQQGRIQIVATSVASSSMNQAGQQQTKLITVPAGQPQKLTLHQAQLLASGGSQSIQPQTSTTQIQLQSVPAQSVQGRVQLVTTVPSTQASVPGQGQQGTSGGQGQSLIATGVKQQQVATNAIVSSALLVSVPGMGQRVLTAAPQAGQQIIRRVTEAEIAQLLKQQQQQNQPK